MNSSLISPQTFPTVNECIHSTSIETLPTSQKFRSFAKAALKWETHREMKYKKTSIVTDYTLKNQLKGKKKIHKKMGNCKSNQIKEARKKSNSGQKNVCTFVLESEMH